MLYHEMREVFRYLYERTERYSVTAALCDEANRWTVMVADEWGAGYRLASFAAFERRFPHLMLKTERPAYYGSADACMSWWQVMLSMGRIERRYPDIRVRGLLQNSVGRFDLAVVKEVPAAERASRSGVYLVGSYDDVERILAA